MEKETLKPGGLSEVIYSKSWKWNSEEIKVKKKTYIAVGAGVLVILLSIAFLTLFLMSAGQRSGTGSPAVRSADTEDGERKKADLSDAEMSGTGTEEDEKQDQGQITGERQGDREKSASAVDRTPIGDYETWTDQGSAPEDSGLADSPSQPGLTGEEDQDQPLDPEDGTEDQDDPLEQIHSEWGPLF